MFPEYVSAMLSLRDGFSGEQSNIIPSASMNESGQLEIAFTGFGEKTAPEGRGSPILIEVYKGKLLLRVWSDINKEDPTFTIDLEGARESARVSDFPAKDLVHHF